jgi:hypothetical protein
MSLTAYQSFVVGWYALHGKDAATHKDGKWTEIHSGGQTFYLADRVLEDIDGRPDGTSAYRILYGYHLDQGNLHCRVWYYSGSEAQWRAFTSFRESGAWAKGAEGLGPDPEPEYTHMGYVNECFVTSEMHTLLEAFWNREACSRTYSEVCPWTATEKKEVLYKNGTKKIVTVLKTPAKSASDLSAFQYMVGKASVIRTQYLGEREFKLANLETTNTESTENSKKTGSVKLQQAFDGKIKGHGHVFKHDTALYKWILGCLNGYSHKEKKYHPVLKSDYTIFSFRLQGAKGGGCGDDLIVEIAATDTPQEHRYKDYTGCVRMLNTPVCWVRDVYYASSPTNTFGSRKNIPPNLFFLVQKPCDYSSQISDYYNKKIGITKIGDKYAGDLGGGKYVILSMLNEATSPLIKAFKDVFCYPRFREKYHQAKIFPAALHLPYPESIPYADFLKALISSGIGEYFNIQLHGAANVYGKDSGHHGSDGIRRAEELHKEIVKCQNADEISRVFHRCFIDNKVGSFSGGWFSGIRTNPTSLFTCVCRCLLSLAVVKDSSLRSVKERKDEKVDMSRQPGVKGPENGIKRMILYLKVQFPISENDDELQYITKIADKLLGALE